MAGWPNHKSTIAYPADVLSKIYHSYQDFQLKLSVDIRTTGLIDAGGLIHDSILPKDFIPNIYVQWDFSSE